MSGHDEYIVGKIDVTRPGTTQTTIEVEKFDNCVIISDDEYGSVPVPYGRLRALSHLLIKAGGPTGPNDLLDDRGPTGAFPPRITRAALVGALEAQLKNVTDHLIGLYETDEIIAALLACGVEVVG